MKGVDDLKSLRRRLIAKVLDQKYRSTKKGCIVKDCFGSTEFPYKLSNKDLLILLKLHKYPPTNQVDFVERAGFDLNEMLKN